jgi:hypothetical protein
VTLLDELRAASTRRGPHCSVDVLLNSIEPDLAKEVREAMVDSTITKTVLARGLRANGHRVTDEAVQRHSRGSCSCLSPTS